MGRCTSLGLRAVGVCLDFAVAVHTTGFNINTIGLILMIVGAVGLVLSLLFWNSWGGAGFGRGVSRTRRVGPGGEAYYEERRSTY